jgi:hypothetical protein
MNNLKIVTLDYPTIGMGVSWGNYAGTGSLKTIFGKDTDITHKYLLTTDEIEYGEFGGCYTFDWTLENGTIASTIENVECAKQTFLTNMREVRDGMFPSLDIEYMRALESGNQTKISEIVTKKQNLRDVTNIDLSNVSNFQELRLKWPVDILGEYPYEN